MEQLSWVQLTGMSLIGLILAYLSFAVVMFSQQPPSGRTLTNFLVPFETGPSANTLHRKGVKEFRSGRYREAVGSFRRSLNKQPSNVKGVFLLASSLARLGEYERALKLLERVQSADPGFSRAHIKLAYLQLGFGQFESARRNADRYINQPGVGAQNKIYGYLVKVAGLQFDTSRQEKSIRDAVKSARGLNLPETAFPVRLLELVSGERSTEDLLKKDLSRGETTEVRAWSAVRLLAEGREMVARKHLRWVIERGDKNRYEYDLIGALVSAQGVVNDR